jgi:Zn-dependent peptidase ImmA (M78 family)
MGNPYAFLDDEGEFSAIPDIRAAGVPADVIAADRLKLQNQYAHLNGSGGFSAAPATPMSRFPTLGKDLTGRYASLRSRRRGRRYLYEDIEAKAAELHRLIWQHRNDIWSEGVPANPIEMLDPGVAFQLVGFDFDIADGLGHYFVENRQIEAAGVIDDSTMEARTSRRFSFEIQNFTAAHELGHAVLHDARGLHRDRPLDGSLPVRDPVETEANKFASYFLMPAKLVKQEFQRLFGTDCFLLDEETRFALSRGGVDLNKCHTSRDLARILADATNYNGIRFESLSNLFRVSVEAMAIRLEELGLVPA